MNITDVWKLKFNAGRPTTVPQDDIVQLLWYDGLVLGHIAADFETLLIAFCSESEDKRTRLFLGYLLTSDCLRPEDASFLRSQLSETRATADSEEYENATSRLLNLWEQTTNLILIEADPAFGKVLRSTIVPKSDVEKYWLRMEDFYLLSIEARRLRHERLVQLLGKHELG